MNARSPVQLGRSMGKESAPCKSCRGQCCVWAPMTVREFKTIRAKYGIPKGSTLVELKEPQARMVVTDTLTGRCAYLGSDNRCTVYADRPWICRVYGDNDQFPCQIARPAEAEAKMEAIQSCRNIARTFGGLR